MSIIKTVTFSWERQVIFLFQAVGQTLHSTVFFLYDEYMSPFILRSMNIYSLVELFDSISRDLVAAAARILVPVQGNSRTRETKGLKKR